MANEDSLASEVNEAQPTEQGADVASHHDMALMLEDARSKADEHWNQVLRLQAEMENLRKRSARDLENAHKFALERFAGELLPVKDSLELGLVAAVDDSPAVAKLREGTELTLKMLSQALEKFGIKEINPLGQKFNPEYHQAMTLQPAPDKPANTVLAVFQKGYTLNERLMRPAMVVVSSEGGGEAPSQQINERA